VRDNINYAVQRLIIQCGALLRQQIERAGHAGNRAASEAEVDQVMFRFQAASTQLESMISNEVTAFALERIGQVLEHALNDAKDALGERALQSSQRNAAPRRSAPAIAAQPHEHVPALAAAGPGAPATEAAGEVERGHHDDGGASKPHHGDQRAVEPSVETRAEPSVETRAEPSVEARVEPSVETRAEPSVEARVEPSVEPRVEPRVETDGEIFQGTVGLSIDSHGDTGGIVDFINELRQEHGVLLTQLTGGSNSTSRLILRLPVPIAFRDALRRMRGVSEVFDSRDSNLAGGRPTFTVRLVAREG
jgi:hypothetical protein